MTGGPSPPAGPGKQPEKPLSGAALGKFYTPGLQDQLVDLVRKGNTRAEAAKRCKIAPRTFGYWMARGTANLKECAEAEEREAGAGDRVLDDFGMFRLEIEAAEAVVEASLKDVVFARARSGDKDAWKAAAWILERRYWKRWSRSSGRVSGGGEGEDEGDDGGAEPASVAQGMTAELRANVEAEILGVGAPRRPGG